MLNAGPKVAVNSAIYSPSGGSVGIAFAIPALSFGRGTVRLNAGDKPSFGLF